MGCGRLTVSALVALGVLAGPAHSASITGFDEGYAVQDRRGIRVADPEGEANDLKMTRGGGRVVVRELGNARLRAKGECLKESRRVVVCPPHYGATLVVRLGAGADSLRAFLGSYTPVLIDGGTGDDYLRSPGDNGHFEGGAGDDTLVGGVGEQELYGGAGRDLLRGGDHNDLLVGDGTGRAGGSTGVDDDRLYGGRGRDTASWADHEDPVSVDLREPAHGGAQGERDSMQSIVSVTGGQGNDRLVGDDHSNYLRGGPAWTRCSRGSAMTS